MTLISSVTLDEVCIDGLTVDRGLPLEKYTSVIGLPDNSVMPGPPPPYGHRNNVLHFYNRYGFFLREHHATCLIEGIDFQLDSTDAHFPLSSSYSGVLNVCGIAIQRGMNFTDFARLCTKEFSPHLGHAWYLDGEKISIQFEVRGQKENGNVRREIITELSVGFRGAHKMS